MQYVHFDPGSAVIGTGYESKLKTLAKVLFERPGLKMDLTGEIEPDSDSKVLQEQLFARLLKMEKRKQLHKIKGEVLSADDIVIEQNEYEQYLKKAYRAGTFEKPRNALGFEKRQTTTEMEQLLRGSIKVTENDLRLLALKRAENVKAFFVIHGPVEPERLFIIEPEAYASRAEQEKKPERRVDLVVK